MSIHCRQQVILNSFDLATNFTKINLNRNLYYTKQLKKLNLIAEQIQELSITTQSYHFLKVC